MIMNGNNYGLPVWYANWSKSLLFLHALNHVLSAMANANSSDYIGVCVGCGEWEGTEERMWKCSARFIVSTCSS